MSGKAKFQQYCEKLVASLDEVRRTQFAGLEDDLARIKFLYPLKLAAPIELAAWTPKDLERSESLKNSGNKLFQQRSFQHAISAYNDALLRCPQDFLQGQQLYAILLGNRSAVFFEMKQFANVIRELELMADMKHHHPARYKLEQRAGKACEHLKYFRKAKQFYMNALVELKSHVNSELNSKIVHDIEERLAKLENLQDSTNEPVLTSLQQHIKDMPKNLTFPALSGKIGVCYHPERGRFAVAKHDIKPGEIIAVEEPYTHVLSAPMHRSNCAYCMQSINQLIACESCAEACYCSLSCKQRAASFHQHECRILLTLFDSGVSVNALMALRMICQRPLEQLRQDERDARAERNVVIYRTGDYYNVSKLVSHKNLRTADEYLHYAFMATYLLRLLKSTSMYFEGKRQDDVLQEDEAFVGGIMLKYLQMLQYNAHEICELQNCTRSKDEKGQDANYRTGTVGAGLYPTLALFNHSCDPSVIRYNLGNVMVLRAIKPILCGEGVYENYGPLYTTEERCVRISKMQNLYRFQCDCHACNENWPLFSQMDSNILSLACDCGRVIPTHKDIEMPFVTCTGCKKEKNLWPTLKGLMPLEAQSRQVEELFQTGEYEKSGNLAAEMLQTYVKYLVPPFADMVLLQQRLKSCLIHNGNKKFDYRDLSVANSRQPD